MPNKTYELRNLYLQQSHDYATEATVAPCWPILAWPENGYFENLKLDAKLLWQALNQPANDRAPISQQVFGNDARQQGVIMRHLANLLYERCRLHKQHIEDIDQRHIEIQEKKFGVEINHTPDSARRLSALETQLLQLENTRREEELTFWKDSMELRDKLFEITGSYGDAVQRLGLFAAAEAAYDKSQ